MTLVYTDRNGDGRLQPTVDAIDVQGNPKAHSTTSISPRSVGTQAAAKVITKDSRIIGYDGSNNIGLFGFDDAGNMVVKVAKAGYDANSATNDQLVFNSSQDTFKVATVLTGSLAVSFSALSQGSSGPGTYTATSTNSLTLPHGLSATPAIVPFLYDATSAVYVPFNNNTLISGASWSQTNPLLIFNNLPAVTGVASYYWNISVNATNVVIRGLMSGGQVQSTTMPAQNFPSCSFKVYCLQETAN